MHWFFGAWAVFEKDIRQELRQRFVLNTLLLFVLASVLIVRFTIAQDTLAPRLHSALLWIVILFASATGLSRAFVAEEERGTVYLLRLNTRPSMVYAGKLVFNFVLMLVLNTLAIGLYLVLLNVRVGAPGVLTGVLLLGALGLAGATTLIAALIARSFNQGPLFAVLSFPILVPLLLTVVGATEAALEGTGWQALQSDFLTLVGYAGTLITASVLLFDYVWAD